MLMESFVVEAFFLSLLGLAADGACGLSLLGALSLLMGRRRNAALCKAGFLALLLGALCLGIAGVIYYPFSCYLVLAPHKGGPGFTAGFFSLAGMPWLSAWLAWICGLLLLLLAGRARLVIKIDGAMDSYAFRAINFPFICALLASFCFFAAFFLANWPFAGLPPELSTQRVLVAVARHAFRHWIISLSAGGAFALALAPSFLRKLTVGREIQSGVYRWCAVWAAGCALPATFQNFGLLLGIIAKGQAYMTVNSGAYGQIFMILFASAAFLCWLWCLWKKRSGFAAWLGLFFLLLKTLAPIIS